jgi:hypothetical protein
VTEKYLIAEQSLLEFEGKKIKACAFLQRGKGREKEAREEWTERNIIASNWV